METTVTYDNKTKEFIVNSPTPLSQKYWITNSVLHATHTLVFGQTIVNGKNEGVNAFVVQIRESEQKGNGLRGNTKKGVEIVDMGWRFGLNGVDNGALKFNNVRIPRENMMNKYADISETGEYTSPVKSIPGRFFKVTERLLSGRLCIASMGMGATRACLYIALKYSM